MWKIEFSIFYCPMDIILFFSMKFSYVSRRKIFVRGIGSGMSLSNDLLRWNHARLNKFERTPDITTALENSLFRRDLSSSCVTAAVNTTTRYPVIYYLALNFRIALISSADVESRRLNQTISFDATKSIAAIYIRRDRKDVGNK